MESKQVKNKASHVKPKRVKSKKTQRLVKGKNVINDAIVIYTNRMPRDLATYCHKIGADKVREILQLNKDAGVGHEVVKVDGVTGRYYLTAKLTSDENDVVQILRGCYCKFKSKKVNGKLELYSWEKSKDIKTELDNYFKFCKEVEIARHYHWWYPDPITDDQLEEAFLIVTDHWDTQPGDLIDRCNGNKELWRQTYLKLRLFEQVEEAWHRKNRENIAIQYPGTPPGHIPSGWTAKTKLDEELANAWQAEKQRWNQQGVKLLVE